VVVPTLQVFRTLLQLLIRVLLLSVVAEDRLVDHRMENLFFPPVVLATERLQRTPFLILADKVAGLPRLTNLKWVVQEEMWLSTEVLPIVRVTALRLVVFGTEGTPLSLKVKHVELLAPRHLMNQWGLNVDLGMGKRTELFVFALVKRLRTKFSFIFLYMVEALDLVMSEFTRIIVALLVGAEVNAIVVQGGAPSLIRNCVVLGAPFLVMRFGNAALGNFEDLEVHLLLILVKHIKKL
jgi:hypothetical protein